MCSGSIIDFQPKDREFESLFQHMNLKSADHVATDVRVDVITLLVSFDRTLERVVADVDPGRVASRNPEILKWLHNQFVAALPYLKANSTVVEADLESIDGVAVQIAELVLRNYSP